MSSMEFEEWRIFYELHPSTEDRIELGFARLLTTLANLTREKKQRPYQLTDFLPDYGGQRSGKQERRRPVKELKEKFLQWARAHNKWWAKKQGTEEVDVDANPEHRINSDSPQREDS